MLLPELLVYHRRLVDEVLAPIRLLEPTVHSGRMCGCPTAFVGWRMAFCVYGPAIGAKVPEGLARRLIDEGRAAAFHPYAGRPCENGDGSTPNA